MGHTGFAFVVGLCVYVFVVVCGGGGGGGGVCVCVYIVIDVSQHAQLAFSKKRLLVRDMLLSSTQEWPN